MPELLRVQNIGKHFDGTQALRNVSLSVFPGEVHALVGENGAGKSTLAKVMAGAVIPDQGEIHLDGAEVFLRSGLDAQRLGIGIIFQELDLFPHLTVAENIVIGNVRAERGVMAARQAMDQFCVPLLRQVGLDCSPRRLAKDLSLAQRQLLAIARALGMNARLIIMDEPTSSLPADCVETLFDSIRALKQNGVAIVYVSHKMDEIFRIGDRITVLRDGKLIACKPAAGTNIAEVIAMMVGRELLESERRAAPEATRLLLRVQSLQTAKLRNISFDLHAGEVLGIAGLVGSGRSSLGAALFGLDPIVGGSIEFNGRPFHPKSPADALKQGFGLVPEDRKSQGLMMQMSVLENSSLTVLDRIQSFGFLRRAEEQREGSEVHRRLRLETVPPGMPAGRLSGGNQQKVLLARWLWRDPEVLFLDDPARGIDIGAKYDIYEVLNQLSAAGKGILLVSSELPELLRCSDRILVLAGGESKGILQRAEATQENIMALAARRSQEIRRLG